MQLPVSLYTEENEEGKKDKARETFFAIPVSSTCETDVCVRKIVFLSFPFLFTSGSSRASLLFQFSFFRLFFCTKEMSNMDFFINREKEMKTRIFRVLLCMNRRLTS